MLSFEEKKTIFHSFNLKEKKISNGRVNFIYPESKQKGQVLATQLHPSGNGYVIGKYMSKDTIMKHRYKVDPRGWISIRDFSKDELMSVISDAMKSMNGIQEVTEMVVEKKDNPPIAANQALQNSSALEVYPGSCLFAWLGLTLSSMEFGYLVWKKALRKYGGISLLK
ncbi:hypothetical protein ABES03_22540 [Neobacillus rhizosphaerae]|uniref:hypothetical protein n=1 Tax=Neobacillus rhizosphaerae TaxID=2880965 RepID=UPI003D293B8D